MKHIHIYLSVKAKDTSFNEALQQALQAREITNKASKGLKNFPRGAMGLVSENVRLSSEYRQAKNEYNQAFENEKKYNLVLLRDFKKEYLAYTSANRYGLK